MSREKQRIERLQGVRAFLEALALSCYGRPQPWDWLRISQSRGRTHARAARGIARPQPTATSPFTIVSRSFPNKDLKNTFFLSFFGFAEYLTSFDDFFSLC